MHSVKRADCILGVNYLDQREIYGNLIKAEMKKCFNYECVIRKEKEPTKRLKSRGNLLAVAICKLCNKEVESWNCEMRKHCVHHKV